MKIGCCTNMNASCPDGTGVEHIGQLKQLGYDYIELPLAQIMALSEHDFENLLAQVRTSGLPCEACNNFFPEHIRLTGPKVDYEVISAYLDQALQRAAALGVKIIVFGSSGARNVPEGFSKAIAWQQIIRLLQFVDDKVKPFGLTVVIEPLNKLESNIINSLTEGLQMVKEVSRKNIKLLVDYYHLVLEKEDTEVLLEAGSMIRHVHFSKPKGRVFPKETDEDDYYSFFRVLKRTGYNSRVSVEAYSKQFSQDAAKTLALLKSLCN